MAAALDWAVPADVAQLVEHFTRNEGVRGSSPRVGFRSQAVPPSLRGDERPFGSLLGHYFLLVRLAAHSDLALRLRSTPKVLRPVAARTVAVTLAGVQRQERRLAFRVQTHALLDLASESFDGPLVAASALGVCDLERAMLLVVATDFLEVAAVEAKPTAGGGGSGSVGLPPGFRPFAGNGPLAMRAETPLSAGFRAAPDLCSGRVWPVGVVLIAPLGRRLRPRLNRRTHDELGRDDRVVVGAYEADVRHQIPLLRAAVDLWASLR